MDWIQMLKGKSLKEYLGKYILEPEIETLFETGYDTGIAFLQLTKEKLEKTEGLKKMRDGHKDAILGLIDGLFIS